VRLVLLFICVCAGSVDDDWLCVVGFIMVFICGVFWGIVIEWFDNVFFVVVE